MHLEVFNSQFFKKKNLPFSLTMEHLKETLESTHNRNNHFSDMRPPTHI